MQIIEALGEFLEAQNQSNIEKQLKYIYPKFQGLTRDSTISVIRRYIEQQKKVDSTYIPTHFKLDSINFISEVIEKNGEKYALIKYSQTTSQDYSSLQDQGGASLAVSAALITLKKDLGENNVKWNKEKLAIEIYHHEKQYCILDSIDNQWKFVFDTTSVESIFEDVED